MTAGDAARGAGLATLGAVAVFAGHWLWSDDPSSARRGLPVGLNRMEERARPAPARERLRASAAPSGRMLVIPEAAPEPAAWAAERGRLSAFEGSVARANPAPRGPQALEPGSDLADAADVGDKGLVRVEAGLERGEGDIGSDAALLEALLTTIKRGGRCAVVLGSAEEYDQRASVYQRQISGSDFPAFESLRAAALETTEAVAARPRADLSPDPCKRRLQATLDELSASSFYAAGGG